MKNRLQTITRNEDAIQAGVELVLLLPIIVFLILYIVNQFSAVYARTEVNAALRDAVRMASSYGGNCGKYRPQTMIKAGGECQGQQGSPTGGQSVSQAANNMFRYQKYVNRIVTENGGIRCGNGTSNNFQPATASTTKGEVAGQTEYVGDIVSCRIKWMAVPIGIPSILTFPNGYETSLAISTSDVGTLIDNKK